MAVSDQLFKLATHTKETEDKVKAAHGKARADLEADVNAAQASAKKQSEALRSKFEQQGGKISASWDSARRGLDEAVASAKEKMEGRKLEHDAKKAAHHADRAESDAAFAIDFALAAVEQAQSEALDAILARQHADDLAAGQVTA